ncbi:MAG TPA: ornithine carbamoyltransferase [Thermoanaerobaculia bacterium]|nr:ornithine carbamoyltransferase [Thermoanaerobaculia bacterium]
MSDPVLDELKNRDFLGLKDFTAQQIEALLRRAADLKAGREDGKPLADRTLGMLFTVPSTRTRISFQVAARQLGGHAEYYSPDQLQMSNNETLIDTAEVMNRYLDGLVVRLYDMSRYGEGRRSLELLAERMRGPVVNALDDKEHPCQILADLLTVQERFGEAWRDKKVVLTWGWAKRQKSTGVTHSWLTAAALLGMRFTLAFPEGFEPDEEYAAFAREAAAASGARIEMSHDLDEASEGADVIYAKSWMSLRGTKQDDAALRENLRHWRVAQRHFDRANPGAVFMDCMPLIRGDEADAEVVDGPQSIRYDEAENRLHVQKAVLASVL